MTATPGDNLLHRIRAMRKRLGPLSQRGIIALGEAEQWRRDLDHLMENEQRFRVVFEKSPIGIALLTLDFEFLDANPSFCRFLGYSVGEFRRLSIPDVTHPDDLRENLALQLRLGAGEIPFFQMEKRFIRKDGAVVHGKLVATLLTDDDGTPSAFLGQVMDITEEKKARRERALFEERLRQVRKMEAIATMSGGIAHDFNNILSSIIGFTELSLDEVPENSGVGDNLRHILEAGYRARDLVRRILMLSPQDDGGREPVSIATLTGDAVRLMAPSLPGHVTLDSRIDIPEHVTVKGNPSQLNQMLLNLCRNAVEAIEVPRGRIAIEGTVRQWRVGDPARPPELVPGPYARIAISDNGRGIGAEYLSRIFDPYFTTRREDNAAGWGLTLARSIAQRHGGGIFVSSIPGKGSVFEIYLPVTEIQRVPAPRPPVPLEPSGRKHLLVVDDEKSITLLLERMLSDIGYRVTARNSPLEALDLFRERPGDFDLLLTDMSMPHMNGDRLAAEVKSIRSDIPVILSTGFHERVTEDLLTQMGIDRLLMKPARRAQILAALRETLEGAASCQ